jgi:hypothetical protein
MTNPLHDSTDDVWLKKLHAIKLEPAVWGPPASVAKLSRVERAAAERKLMRKIDSRIMPPLVVMYILSTADVDAH